MNDHDNSFSLKKSGRSRMPSPADLGGIQQDNNSSSGKKTSGFKLSPANINSAFKCAEIILKAKARCAEIRALCDADLERMDKEIEVVRAKTDDYILKLRERSQVMDEAMERTLRFGAGLKELGYSEAVQLALVTAYTEEIKKVQSPQ